MSARPAQRGKPVLAAVGAAIIAVLVVTALLAPWLAPRSVSDQELPRRLDPPSAERPLGCDELGRDILSRMIHGSRISLRVGLSVVLISGGLGLLIGMISGYCGGLVDELLMRLIDILLAFPGILLAIAMVAVLGPGLNHVIIALCLIGWVGYARLARGQTLLVKELDFVTAARAQGCGPLRLMFRHVAPNILGPVIVQATLGMAGAILAEAGLSFLGLGVVPPAPSWGAMLNTGCSHLSTAPHLTLFPGLAIMLVVLGFNFLGDGLRDVLDPKLKKR
jgi:peptide/nickel transport system permease protein